LQYFNAIVGSLEAPRPSSRATNPTSPDELVTIEATPKPGSKQHEDNVVHCILCLRREQEELAKRNGFGHISRVKSYAITTSTCVLNKHLKETHNVTESATAAQTAGPSTKQTSISKCTEGASKLGPAHSRFDLNKDFTVW
jgi:hypothetical protein